MGGDDVQTIVCAWRGVLGKQDWVGGHLVFFFFSGREWKGGWKEPIAGWGPGWEGKDKRKFQRNRQREPMAIAIYSIQTPGNRGSLLEAKLGANGV